MFCPLCGSPISPESKFCEQCGTPVQVSDSQPDTRQRPQASTSPEPFPAKPKWPWLWVIALVIVCLAVTAYGASQGPDEYNTAYHAGESLGYAAIGAVIFGVLFLRKRGPFPPVIAFVAIFASSWLGLQIANTSASVPSGNSASNRQPEPTTAQTAPSPAESSKDDSPPAKDGWQLSSGTSPMDGELVMAQRTFAIADSDTSIQVSFICTVQKGELAIKIGSYVGSISHATDASAYQTVESLIMPSVRVPQGRIKFGDFQPGSLGSYFNTTNFANEIEMDVNHHGAIPLIMNNNDTVALSGGVLGYYTKMKQITIDGRKLDQNPLSGSASGQNTYNAVAALGYLFPINVEVVNGSGTYDVTIDKSGPITTVLDRCGSGSPVLNPSLVMTPTDVAARNSEVAQAAAEHQAQMDRVAEERAIQSKWLSGQAGADKLAHEIRTYVEDHRGRLPESLQTLVNTQRTAMIAAGYSNTDGSPMTYAKSRDLTDPFGNPYGYHIVGPSQFQVIFYGADGVPGGSGPNRDYATR